ncbi:MAG TPA: zinc dependent phospholipase C family protein, partial [Chloroflexota bacterium]|nr:zinc dependent phospholipase C family protein [Chloroflexota bacterium]
MPSTYIHFWVAADVAASGAFSLGSQAESDAYLCGNAAPDIHLLGGPARPATHFWEIGEPVPGRLGAARLLGAHPHLAAARLDPVGRAFVAGYLCHLAVDEAWIRVVYLPFFGPETTVGGPEGIALQRAYYSVLERR